MTAEPSMMTSPSGVLNSSFAGWPMMFRISLGSSTSGISTRMRSVPCCVTVASVKPWPVKRLRSTAMVPDSRFA